MKRVLAPEKEYSSLKPFFGQNGAKPPFYDPYDSHLHIWVDGVLKSEENHKQMYFSKKVDQSLKRCTYCSVCHEIKSSINKININNHYSDKLFPIGEEGESDKDGEKSNLENGFNYVDSIKLTSSENETENETDLINYEQDLDKVYNSLFLPKRGIYKNYLKVDESDQIDLTDIS